VERFKNGIRGNAVGMPTYEDWPTEERTVVRQPSAPPPPFTPPPGEPVPPPGRGPDDGIGWGFLIGILILLVVGGIVAAVLLTRDHNKKSAQTTTTVLVRTGVTTTVPATRTAQTTTVTTVTTPAVKTPPVTTPAGKATTTVTTTTASTAPTSSSPSGSTPTTSTSSGSASPPPRSVSVPDVGSSQAQSAIQQLNSAGLLVTLAYVPNDQPLGTVVAESPQAGSSAQTGSHVTLNLSAGPSSAGSGSVPSLTGQSIPQAVSATKQAGLRLIFVRKPVTDQSQAGKVVEQTPAPGTCVPKNAKVLVYMGAVR